jgi:C1A family cysteine protease
MAELTPRQIERYGWRRQPHDIRDLNFAAVAPLSTLPTIVDLRPGFQPCYDQGQLGSCTANAVAGIVEYAHRKQHIEDYIPSRLFIYWWERFLEGGLNQTRQDTGAFLRDGLKTINQKGCPHEALWPYIISRFTQKPPLAVEADGARHRVTQYMAVNQTQNDLFTALANNMPVAFGFEVYSSFETSQVARTGVVPMPSHNEQLLGGHAVALVGYDTLNNVFMCRNSWGSTWGKQGYFTLPFSYVLDSNLASDFWCVQVAS